MQCFSWWKIAVKFLHGAHGQSIEMKRRQLDLLATRGEESSAVAAALYDYRVRRLRIRYRPRGTYDYLDVPPVVIERAIEAESLGQFINRQIKPNYEYKQVN